MSSIEEISAASACLALERVIVTIPAKQISIEIISKGRIGSPKKTHARILVQNELVCQMIIKNVNGIKVTQRFRK